MDDEMFSVLTEGLTQDGPKAAELVSAPVAQPAVATPASGDTVTIGRSTLLIGLAGIIGLLILAYILFRPKKAINIVAEKAQYNALFDAPFSSLPGPLMKMPADHLKGHSATGAADTGLHAAPYVTSAHRLAEPAESFDPVVPVLAPAEDIVPVSGVIPIWGDETVTEKAEPRVDEQSMDIKRLIAEREAFSAAIEREAAESLKSQAPS